MYTILSYVKPVPIPNTEKKNSMQIIGKGQGDHWYHMKWIGFLNT